jgi:PAS domain S-box-containing protein
MDFLKTMRAVWDDSLDGIVVADTDTIILEVNPAYCQMTGYTREQLIGKRTNVIRSGLTPRSVFHEMWAHLGSEGKWVGEVINQRPDGSLWISYISITAVSGRDGRPEAFVGLSRDITDRRNLEDLLRSQSTRLSSLLEAIVVGVVMFDPDETCVVANQVLGELLGTGADALLGKRRAEIQPLFTRIFGQDGLLSPAEWTGGVTVATREPTPRYFIVRWAPVTASSGADLGQIFTFRDVTRETELDRMKSEFVATVSHELRTPMTSVKAALGLLLAGAAGPVDGPQQELLEVAHNNVDRLIRLINDILDISRLESGRLELRTRPVQIDELITGAARELESVRSQREITLKLALLPDPPPVLADPDRIIQVLVNLLGNAYKFTGESGTVTVRTYADGRDLYVQVEDTGPGIAADQVEAIFERFQRGAAAARSSGGTGLGLAISRALVQQHKGRIWAESESGRGAVFTFTLPLV